MNNYKDTPELKARMHSPLMERIVELKENFYSEADKYDYAPADFADAMDNFDRVLELTGSVCDEVIAYSTPRVLPIILRLCIRPDFQDSDYPVSMEV